MKRKPNEFADFLFWVESAKAWAAIITLGTDPDRRALCRRGVVRSATLGRLARRVLLHTMAQAEGGALWSVNKPGSGKTLLRTMAEGGAA